MYYPDFETFRRIAGKGNLIPVYREILADTITPVLALMKLRSRKGLFLLESMEGGEKWGRYSFLGIDPRSTFRVRGNCVQIEDDRGIETLEHHGDPLRCLKEILTRYKPVRVEGLPRFFGGAVGYLSYDMVRYFEGIPDSGAKDIEGDDATFFITDTLLIFDNVRHTVKVLACAFLEEEKEFDTAYCDVKAKIEALIFELLRPETGGNDDSIDRIDKQKLPAFSPSMAPKGLKPSAETSEENGHHEGVGLQATRGECARSIRFKSIVERAKEYILSGDIIQVVLSQRFQYDGKMDPVNLYRSLRHVNPSPYLFYLQFEDQIMIGSSPEVMVRLEDEQVELKPIAGTRPRGKNEQEDRRLADELLNDPKERAEHVMLVDLGRNDLGRIGRTGSVQVTQLMAVERYSHVMHMVSNIKAYLDEGKDGFDVVRATFPAGTLSGAPKVRAMEIIEELEPSRRGPYGGAVGYFSYSGNMDLCITIRTILLRDERIIIQAGAGIVADSDPDREYEEVNHKAAALIKAVELAASGLEI
ncbi:MAG: anthranilate synthase component I [Desulfobacteraceae bacterium]|nr:MAG: anthranilate synthase component I [Desulfobacteraceae bacterium]